ncbi:MAG: hypothetical protein LBD07_05955, partial [Spirochaetaceae bacterium]|nr:hypothetical protein [Spirochaetaceae bacterium]
RYRLDGKNRGGLGVLREAVRLRALRRLCRNGRGRRGVLSQEKSKMLYPERAHAVLGRRQTH